MLESLQIFPLPCTIIQKVLNPVVWLNDQLSFELLTNRGTICYQPNDKHQRRQGFSCYILHT